MPAMSKLALGLVASIAAAAAIGCSDSGGEASYGGFVSLSGLGAYASFVANVTGSGTLPTASDPYGTIPMGGCIAPPAAVVNTSLVFTPLEVGANVILSGAAAVTLPRSGAGAYASSGATLPPGRYDVTLAGS